MVTYVLGKKVTVIRPSEIREQRIAERKKLTETGIYPPYNIRRKRAKLTEHVRALSQPSVEAKKPEAQEETLLFGVIPYQTLPILIMGIIILILITVVFS